MRFLIPVLIPMLAGTIAAQPPVPPVPPATPPVARPLPVVETPTVMRADEMRIRSADLVDELRLRSGDFMGPLTLRAEEMSIRAAEAAELYSVLASEAMISRGTMDAQWVMSAEHAELSARSAMLTSEALNFSRNAIEWAGGPDGMRIVSGGSSPFITRAPTAWLAQDPADSLYRAASQLLNRQEYRQAATLFRSLPQRFPRSGYAADALYWEAFSLYRLGETRDALRTLDTLQARHSRHSRQTDAAALSTRVLGQLAAQGDAAANSRLAQAARQGNLSCDPQEMAVRTEALNALSRMNAEGMGPTLESVLSRRDACSTSLRQSALTLLHKQPDSVKEPILTNLARTEPTVSVRRDAINWLGQIPGDRPLAVLEGILRTPADSTFHATVLRALATNDSPRARQLVRGLVEQRDASLRLRMDAIASLERNTSSDENATYLRSVYTRLDSAGLRHRTIDAVSKMKGEENQQWLSAIARNTSEPMSARKKALSYTTRSTVPIAEVTALYDALPEYDLKQTVISALGSRKEPEATDKLIAIVKNAGGDPQLRRLAIGALSRKNDPRTQALLMEILKT